MLAMLLDASAREHWAKATSSQFKLCHLDVVELIVPSWKYWVAGLPLAGAITIIYEKDAGTVNDDGVEQWFPIS